MATFSSSAFVFVETLRGNLNEAKKEQHQKDKYTVCICVCVCTCVCFVNIMLPQSSQVDLLLLIYNWFSFVFV